MADKYSVISLAGGGEGREQDSMVHESMIRRKVCGFPPETRDEKLHLEILDSRNNEYGSVVYRVRWVTHSWSTEENLIGYQNIIKAYWMKKNAHPNIEGISDKEIRLKTKNHDANQSSNIQVNQNYDFTKATNGDSKMKEDNIHVLVDTYSSIGDQQYIKDLNDNHINMRLVHERKKKRYSDNEGNEFSGGSTVSEEELVAAQFKSLSDPKKIKDVAALPHTSRSRRKGNPRKVNVELLEHNDDTSNLNTDDNKVSMKAFRYHPMQREMCGGSLSDKHRRTASNQAKSVSSRLRCDYCCITFENEYYYDLHMSSHDPEEEIYLENLEDSEVWQVSEEDLNLFQEMPHGNSDEDVEQSFKKVQEKVHRNVPQSCEICYKTFIYKKSMRKHKLDCHSSTTCTTCWKTYINTQTLSEHKCELPVKEVKSKSKKIIVSAIKENHGMNHAMNISPFNSLQCNICDKTFKHASDLRKHAVCHSDETPFPCTKCDKKFKRKKNLNSHLERCLGPNKVQLTCSRCPKTFWTQGYLRMHERIHDGTNPYYCKPCDKYFLKKSKLQRHLASDERRKLRTENAEAMKKLPFKCSFCEKVFLDKRNHDMHERIHKGTNPHYCKECDHYFLKRRHLIHHLKSVHSDETPFSCMKCDKRFKFNEALNAHMRSHEKESTGIGKFQCITCGKMFTGLLNLKEHLNVSVTCVSLECELCGQKFLRKKQLTRHMVVHTKERPFPCSQCHRAYAFKWELTKHERTHMKEKQYSCDRCNETFSQKSELSDHIIWHETGKYLNDCPECGQNVDKQSKIDNVEGNNGDIHENPCGTCGKRYTGRFGLKHHGENPSTIQENWEGVLSCFVCKQRGFTEESLEIHQLCHMRVETMDKGDSNPLSLEMLSRFNLQKDEEYHRVHNSEDKNVEVCEGEINKGMITVNPVIESDPLITSSKDRTLTYCSEETKDCSTLMHSLNESTAPRTTITKVHSETDMKTVYVLPEGNRSNHHIEVGEMAAQPSSFIGVSRQNSVENNSPNKSLHQQYLQPNSTEHHSSENIAYNDSNLESNSPLPMTQLHTSTGCSPPISTTEYISTTDASTAGCYSHKKELLPTTSQPMLVPSSSTENGPEISPSIESHSALTSDTIFPTHSVTQRITPIHHSTSSTSLPSTVQDNLLDPSSKFPSIQNSVSTCTTRRHHRLDEATTQYDLLDSPTLSQIASHYPASPQSLPCVSPQYISSQISVSHHTTHHTSDLPSSQSAQVATTISESNSPKFHNDAKAVPPLISSQNVKSHKDGLILPHDSFVPTASQYITQPYSKIYYNKPNSHGQLFTTEHNVTHITSAQTFNCQREAERLTPSPPVQPRGYTDTLEFNNEDLKKDSVSEMATFKPLSLGLSEPQHVNILPSFTDVLHGNTRFSSSEIPSLYSNQRIPLSDSLVSHSLENETKNRQFDYNTDFLQKKIPYNLSSCSQLENLPALVDNYPPPYLSSMQNNIDNVGTIPGQKLLDSTHLYSNIQSSSHNKELPHNVDKLLIQDSTYCT